MKASLGCVRVAAEEVAVSMAVVLVSWYFDQVCEVRHLVNAT